ncbi:MAG: zinc ribbon domain-containing protein [Chloroflexi bacterium]|nr:zinc ribbon domain-containing protein [Chloroflexota bacterium]
MSGRSAGPRPGAATAAATHGYRLRGWDPSRYLLTGQLVCGECGSRYVVQRHRSGVVHYGCAARYDRGPVACGNGRLVRREVVEQRVLDYLPAAHAHRRYSLLHPLHSPWVPGALDGANQHRIQPFRGKPVRRFQRRVRRWRLRSGTWCLSTRSTSTSSKPWARSANPDALSVHRML